MNRNQWYHFGEGAFDLLATWWLQAFLLLLIGSIATVALKKAAFQSLVIRVTFFAVLLCPLMTQLLSSLGLTLLRMDWQKQVAQYSLSQQSSDTPTSLQPVPNTGSDFALRARETDRLAQGSSDLVQPSSNSAESLETETADGFAIASQEPAMRSGRTDVGGIPFWTWASLVLLAVWLTGTILLMLRLGAHLWRGQWLLRQSIPAEEESQRCCDEVAERLQISVAPQVRVNPFLSSPCLLGHFRPFILLPDEVDPRTHKQVFVHELAHLRRSDWIWSVVGQVAVALLWCQPLVWWMHRKHLQLAEEICDDVVIQQGCSRENYLQQLVEIAERSLPVKYPVGVAMVGFRSKLGRRAIRILDSQRALSTQAGLRFATLVLLVMIPLTTGVAMVELGHPQRLGSRESTTTELGLPGTTSQTGAENLEGGAFTILSEGDAKQPSDGLAISGQVWLNDGSAAKGAFVAIVASKLKSGMSGDYEVLAETTTDKNGAYLIKLADVTEHTHANAYWIARTEDSAVAWKKLDLHQSTQNLGQTQLAPAQSIQVRLVDREGQPASKLQTKVLAIMSQDPADRANSIWFYRLAQFSQAWITPAPTDDKGLLTIHNLPEGFGVLLQVPPSDRFAVQDLILNSGDSEERGENDGTYRPAVKNLQPGEIAKISLEPAKVFEGIVTLGKDGPPAANARIEMWASQQEELGSMVSVDGTTDDKGRFRIIPYPGVRFGLTAFPPEGQPYQVSKLDDIRWSSAEEAKNIQIALPKGVLARGIVVDQDSGEPIKNASIQYYPMASNTNDRERVVTGWQGIRTTNANGDFNIPVLSGEGWLIVHANETKYVVQQKTGREIAYGKPGGARYYAHRFVKIDPPADQDFEPVKVELQKSVPVTLEVVDPAGQPVDEAMVITRLNVLPSFVGNFRHTDQFSVRQGRVDLYGLSESDTCEVQLLDKHRNLGASLTITAGQPAQKVTLQPCGSMSGRLVNKEGDPVSGGSIFLTQVVSAGPSSYMGSPRKPESVLSDEDFVSDILGEHQKYRSDADGSLLIKNLIPGVTYRYKQPGEESKEYVAESGKTFDLGTIVSGIVTVGD